MNAIACVGSRDFNAPGFIVDFVSDQLLEMLQDETWGLSGFPVPRIVSGGARGPDDIAERAALDVDLHVTSFRPVEISKGYFNIARLDITEPSRCYIPDVEAGCQTCGGPPCFEQPRASVVMNTDTNEPWLFHSFPEAAYFRNGLIVDEVQLVVAFYDGTSRGTRDTINKAMQRGKDLWIIHQHGDEVSTWKSEQSERLASDFLWT